jgi:hypothetical protein
MTRKHYIAIAKILKSTDGIHDYACKAAIAKSMADYFESNNQNFDRERFLTACGVEMAA